MTKTISTVTVHGLVCHRDVDMAFTCFSSLLRFSAQLINLVIHDDGSLTPEDIERLLGGLQGATLVSRTEADELMNQHLKHYPNCHKYRSDQVYGLKLLDISLLSKSDFAYCDSDILFMQPFDEMFHWPNAETSAIFMRDYLDAYSMLPWHLIGANKPRLASKANAGLIFFRKAAYDLDFIEWFLGRNEFRYKVGWSEQTCWAALGHHVGCRLWNPEQIVLMRPNTYLNDNLVAGHFVKEVRYRLGEFACLTENVTQTKKSILVDTINPQQCNFFDLAQVHGMRQLKRAQNYHKIPNKLRQKLFSSYQQTI